MDEDGQEVTTSPWFDLSLGMEINGQRHNILPWLPELIAQASASALDPVTGLPELPPFIYLKAPGGQGFVRLPTDGLKPWMAALLELVGDRSHDFSGDSLKLSRLDAMRTTAALGEGVIWEGAQELRTMVQQLSGRAEMPEVPVPASLQASLRPYQQQGLNWLQFLRTHGLAGILADDMGLGKTLQTLAHIQVEKEGGRLTHPALIIAPVSLMGNWKREAERFCPQLRTLVLHGKDRHEVADTIAQQDIIIAPYSLLKRDRERWLDAKWHLVVLDEAQNIKNANTHAAQVVGELQARHRLCLSGTPMENHLGEIWSLFHFLMPGFLSSQKRFTELFRNPIEKQGNPERMTQLRARITPFMLRRTKALVAGELPPKVETVMRVELAGKQADLYETIRLGMEKTVREALSSKGLAKSQITILDALLKLRQVCCDPHLLKLPAAQKVKTSAKLEQLMELLPEMLSEGRRILLFSQFTTMLALIEDELKKRNISWVKLTGQSQNREALIEQFTSGAVPIFLISLKAGGVWPFKNAKPRWLTPCTAAPPVASSRCLPKVIWRNCSNRCRLDQFGSGLVNAQKFSQCRGAQGTIVGDDLAGSQVAGQDVGHRLHAQAVEKLGVVLDGLLHLGRNTGRGRNTAGVGQNRCFMLAHQLGRVGGGQQGRALRHAFATHDRNRNPHEFDLFVQGQRCLPQVAAMGALGIKHHIHRVGTHHGTDGETFALGCDRLIGLRRLGRFGLVGGVLPGAAPQGHSQCSCEDQDQLHAFHREFLGGLKG